MPAKPTHPIFHRPAGVLRILLFLLFPTGLFCQDNYKDLVTKANQQLNAGSLDEALQLAVRAIQLKPNDPEAHNLAGNAWYEKNEFRKAVEQYNAAIQADPGNKYSYLNRGFSYYKLMDSSRALQDYQKVLRIDPDYSMAYNDIGLIFFDNGASGYPRALENFNVAVTKDTRNKYPYFNKGRIYANTGRYDDAIRELNTAISLDSNFTEAYNLSGTAYSHKEDYRSAIRNYTHAIRLDPGNKYYHRDRGYCYQKIQDEESALLDFNQALKLDPKFAGVYNDIGTIFFGRQYRDTANIQKAMDNYTQSIRFDPGLIYPYYNRGLLQYNRKNYAAAIQDFTRTLQIDSNYLDASYRRGLAYFYKPDYALAMNDFNRALRSHPRHEYALQYLGKAYAQTKAFAKAVETFNKVLAINGQNIDAQLDKAFAYYNGGKPDEALESFTRIIQNAPDNLTARNGRGLVYLYKGKYADAAQEFIFCMRKDPSYGNASANLVVTLLADNQFTSAQSVYNEYKSRNLNGFIENSKFQFVSTYIQACVYHIRTGNYDNAANLLHTAIQEFETFKKMDSYDYLSGQKMLGNIYAKLGYIMEMKGNPVEARNLYKQGLDINPLMPEAKTGYLSQISTPVNVAEIMTQANKVAPGLENKSTVAIPALDPGVAAVHFHALLIAEENYNNDQFTRLKRPVEDATRLKNILINQYNFDAAHVTLLKNPDRNSILFSLNALLRDKTENDNVLIFYAGHGTYDKNDKGEVIEGYWVPVGAAKGQTENYVSGSEMRVALKKTSARHVVVISDACFSGSLTRDAGLDDASGHIQQLYQKNSRQLLASGDLVPVPDNSVFLVYLLKELENNMDPYLTVNELWTRIHKIVSNNSDSDPICVQFRDTGDELGQFVLIRKK
jgi:tetratricopeptide (TPR) repeat protein